MSQLIAEIEEALPVGRIKVGTLEVWQLVRMRAFFSNRDRNVTYPATIAKFCLLVVSFARGLKVFFRRADYWFVSDSSETKLIEGKYSNKQFWMLYKLFPASQCLYLERPLAGAFTSGRGDPHYTPTSAIEVVARTLAIFLTKTLSPDDEQFFSAIEKTYAVSLRVQRDLKSFKAFSIVFSALFKLHRPKLVILTDYYSIVHYALIHVCKGLGIKVVEHQHGIITGGHPAYASYAFKLNPDLLPDMLFAFDHRVREKLGARSFIGPDSIAEVGNPYLVYACEAKANQGNKPAWHDRKNQIVVSHQVPFDRELIEFINELVPLNPDFTFVIVPRAGDIATPLRAAPNVFVAREFDFYTCLASAKYHLTICSTCAYEALDYGVPNLFFDAHGLAEKYFGELRGSPSAAFMENAQPLRPVVERLVAPERIDLSRAKLRRNYETALAKIMQL